MVRTLIGMIPEELVSISDIYSRRQVQITVCSESQAFIPKQRNIVQQKENIHVYFGTHNCLTDVNKKLKMNLVAFERICLWYVIR